jgi:hypothetical protein
MRHLRTRALIDPKATAKPSDLFKRCYLPGLQAPASGFQVSQRGTRAVAALLQRAATPSLTRDSFSPYWDSRREQRVWNPQLILNARYSQRPDTPIARMSTGTASRVRAISHGVTYR